MSTRGCQLVEDWTQKHRVERGTIIYSTSACHALIDYSVDAIRRDFYPKHTVDNSQSIDNLKKCTPL